MKRICTIVCLLLLLAAVFLLIPAETSAMSVVTPTQNVTSSKYFTAYPGVYEMGDGYAVIWATNFSGTGYIKYTYGGVEYTVYDQRNNIVRTNDTIHVVKVPHEHLQGNTYTVYSTEVTSHQYAITNYGTTVSAGPIRLKAYDGGVNDFDVLVMTDVHGQLNWAKAIAARFSEDPDLVVFSGDIVDSIESKATIAKMFNIMGTTTGGRYPIVYCRGNHETRGIWSTALLEYFPTETGEFYFDFRYGPLWGVVIDTGEDKEDTHEYYGNLSNYGEYNQKQERWLRSLRMDETATFRLGIYHIARLHDLKNNGINFTDSIGHLGLQFGVTGHFHTAEIYNKTLNKATSIRHDAFVCGGYAIDAATMVTMNKSTQKAYVTVKTQNGSIYGGFNRHAIALSSYVGSVPGSLSEPELGLNAQFNPSASSKGTVSITVPPTVFETGGDWYNIVWATSTTNSSAKGTTGYVEYEYNGVKYQMFDEIGGYRRSNSNIHTVKVPKEHLNNNAYKVGSFLVNYSYTNPSAQTGRYYSAGDYVVSQEYVFEDRSGDKAVNIIACPDAKLQNNSSTYINALKNVIAGLGTSPAYVVVNGDAVGITLDNTSDLTALFQATSIASGGIHPVIFSRGNAECRGYLATELIKYIPTVTGEFYYSVDAGDYTFVNLDTAEDDPDDQWIAWQGSTVRKYGNRVTFDELRQEQLSWIKGMPSGKLVAISHMPLSTTKSHLGVDFESALKAKGAVLSIGGHDEAYSLKETVNASSIYTIIPGGFNNATSHNIAVSVLLSDDYAYINSCKYQNGTTTYPDSKTVSLSTGKSVSYSATKPSQVNGVYIVSTPGHIKWISQNCKTTYGLSNYKFELANDIDMMLVPFTPIGGNDSVSTDNNTSSYGFGGTFDGKGYTIKNLNIISSNNNVGFFGFVRYGTIRNLTVSSGMVDGGWYVGGMVGSSYAGTFENCYSDLTVYSAGGSKIGGFAGFLSHGSSVDRCANFGHVSAHHSGGSAGGIVGQLYSATTNKIHNTFNRGGIVAHGAGGLAGGIFGYAGNIAADIRNCYNAAAVTSPGSQGAITGGYSSSGNIYIGNTYFATGFNGATTGTKSSNSWSSSAGSGSITSVSQSKMKSQTAANWLNADAFVYVATENDGYPVHACTLHSSGLPEHSYVAVVTAPTCTTGGYTTYTCECGDTYVADEVPAKGHRYTAVVTAPTCTKGGYTTYTCACGDSYVGNQVAATGHSYKTVTVDATCTKDGSITKTCSTCGNVEKQTIPATGHNYKSVVTAPTCTTDGYTTYTCSCGDSYVADRVAATGHNYKSVVTAPTCTKAGYTTYTCACGDSYVANQVAATGHSYKTVTVNATCTKDGSITKTCSTCGNVEKQTIPATGHNHKSVVTAPTCTKAGYTTYTCSCGDSYVADQVPATGHSYKTVTVNATCTKDGSITKTCSTCGNVDKQTIPATGHNHKSVVTAPTCTKAGYTTYTCSCGDSYVADQVPATGHSYKTVTVNATCTKDGSITKTCSTCGNVDKQTIPATGHDYKSVVTAPTCTEEGYTTYTCACGNSYVADWVAANGHNHKSVVTAPTCTKEGYTTYTCSCGDSYVADRVAATGHNYKTVTVDATCTKDGSITKTCSACGKVEKQTIPATGHNHKSVVTAPTCTKAGYTTYTCACGDSYVTDQVPATGHSYKTVTVNATCTKDGSITKTCSTCGNVDKQTIPATGHNYKSVVTAPTCTKAGYTTYTCACGDSYVADQVAATGHSYKTVTVDATCTKDGSITKTCSTCGNVDKQTIPATGHNYKSVVTAPTCTEEGFTTYTCACGDSYVADQVPSTGHKFVNGICTVCFETDPDYVAPVIPYVLIGDMNGWDLSSDIMTGETTVSVTMTLAEGTYQFKIYHGGTYYGNDGIIVNTTATTSVGGWYMNTAAGNCTLKASGGSYRFTFDPETSMLVVTHLTNETEDAPVPNGSITLKSMTLSLEDEIVYNLYFEIADMTVSEKDMGLIVWDSEPVLPTINGGGTVIEGATYLPASNRYGISSMGVSAKDMADLKYMVVYARQNDGSYVYSRVLQYSARTYCLNRVTKSNNEKMRALCVALMNYGAEAQKYFAATTDYTYTQLMNEGFEAYQNLVTAYNGNILNQPNAVDAAKAGIFGTTANGFSSRSVSMSADGTFALNYYFTPSVEVEKVTFYYWTADQYASVKELTKANASGSKEMILSEVANKYWANIGDIAAKDMDQTIYACGVYEVDGVTYSTGVISYSLAKYCMNKASTACDIQDFAAATAVYGHYAKSYFYN